MKLSGTNGLWALSLGKIDKSEYLTGEEILHSSSSQRIQEAKFTYSPLEKAFENQTKTIKDQGDKQIEAVEKQGEKQLAMINDVDLHANEKYNLLFLKQKETFNKLYNKKFNGIDRLNRKVDFNDLNYIYKSDRSINFDTLIQQKVLFERIRDSEITLEYANRQQETFKSLLNQISNKTMEQKRMLDKNAKFYNVWKDIIDLFDNFTITSDTTLIVVAEVNASNTCRSICI